MKRVLIWFMEKINKSELSLPWMSTGRIARDLGLLSRNQNDSKSVQEIDLKLKEMDPLIQSNMIMLYLVLVSMKNFNYYIRIQ